MKKFLFLLIVFAASASEAQHPNVDTTTAPPATKAALPDWMINAPPQKPREWDYVNSTPDGRDYYVNRKIKFAHNSHRVWIKITCSNDTNMPTEALDLAEFDCVDGRCRVIQSVEYYRDGHTMGSDEPGKWSYVVPETVFETIMKRVCASK